MYNPPFVFSLMFNSLEAAEKAEQHLINLDIHSDYLEVDQNNNTLWKLIFCDKDLAYSKKAVTTLRVKPISVKYFDPKNDWQDGLKIL